MFWNGAQTFYFNPLSPCGERLHHTAQRLLSLQFQSTLPMRGETSADHTIFHFVFISIHSPHAGRDPARCRPAHRPPNFNPLSPCGERPNMSSSIPDWRYFNPLSPCGERRDTAGGGFPAEAISIHSPHAGRDDFPMIPKTPCFISIHSPHAGRDQTLEYT